jgi:hypothetical protein
MQEAVIAQYKEMAERIFRERCVPHLPATIQWVEASTFASIPLRRHGMMEQETRGRMRLTQEGELDIEWAREEITNFAENLLVTLQTLDARLYNRVALEVRVPNNNQRIMTCHLHYRQ